MSDYRRRLMMAIFGSSESRDLPVGAIPCDMLYITGGNAFIESGFKPKDTMSYDVDVQWVIYNTADLFGYFIDGHRYTPFRFDSTKPQVAYDGWYNLSSSAFPCYFLHLRCKAVITQTGATVEYYNMDGTLYQSYTVSYSETDYTPHQTLGLLGRKVISGGNPTTDTTVYSSLGRLKCYDDDHFGNLVADFKPCYYNNNFGYWDVVAQSFKASTTPEYILGLGDAWNNKDFVPHAYNSGALSAATTGLASGWAQMSTKVFDIPSGCTSIRFDANGGSGSGSNCTLYLYQSNGNLSTWYGYNTADRVVSVPANATKVRMSMGISQLQNCYIYDVTHQQYIWKGQNVQPGQFLTITKTQMATITDIPVQGGACYGDYLFCFSDVNANVYMYNLRTSTLVQTMNIPVADRGFVSNPHRNTANFGTEFYDANDDFPLIYVSANNNDGTYSGALVYRIVNTGGTYSITLVQTIKFAATTWTEFITAGSYCYVMREENSLEVFYKFAMPTLQDGSEVTLDLTQALSVSSLGAKPAWYAGSRAQGRLFYNGKLYYASGVPTNETLLLIQANLDTGVREMEINLAEVSITTIEPEATFIWENKICIAFAHYTTIYAIDWQ